MQRAHCLSLACHTDNAKLFVSLILDVGLMRSVQIAFALANPRASAIFMFFNALSSSLFKAKMFIHTPLAQHFFLIRNFAAKLLSLLSTFQFEAMRLLNQ